jgi:hypothetical protein
MALSEAFANSATVSTTEYDLPSNSTSISAQTADGVYQLFLDLSAMTATEQYEIKLYEKVGAATTQRVVQTWEVYGVQADPIWASPSVILLNGWTFTVKKIVGTDRSITWSIRQAG